MTTFADLPRYSARMLAGDLRAHGWRACVQNTAGERATVATDAPVGVCYTLAPIALPVPSRAIITTQP